MCESFVENAVTPSELCGDIGLLTRSETGQPTALMVSMPSALNSMEEGEALEMLQSRTTCDNDTGEF